MLFALLSGYWPGLDKKKKALRLDCRDEHDKRENAEMVIKIMTVRGDAAAGGQARCADNQGEPMVARKDGDSGLRGVARLVLVICTTMKGPYNCCGSTCLTGGWCFSL